MATLEHERQDTTRLEDYVRVVKERAWIIVLTTIIVVLIALYMSLTTTPLYSTSARLVYQTNDLDSAVSGYGLFTYDYDRDRTIQTLTTSIRNSTTLAEAVKAQLETEKDAAGLSGMVSVSTSSGSDVVGIVATSTDPEEAAEVANAFADQFIIYRRNEDRATVAEARDVVRKQLDTLTAAELDSEYGLMLQEKYETMRILEAMQDGRFSLLRQAAVPGSPYTPRTQRDVVLALVVGLVLGAGLAFLVEYLDKRVKDEKTLERVSGLPVLTSVPALGGKWRRSKGGRRSDAAVGFEGPGSVLLESFRTLRSSLQYFDVEGTIRSLVVTSGLPQEGKTVTTVNLGISLALSGKRVIILEADLRRPMVHEYLGIENKVGLSSVLAGSSSLTGALQLVLMDSFIPPKDRSAHSEADPMLLRKNLYCMSSGPLPPNPAELLGSARMEQIISELKKLADYLLVDTPPLLPVSDALTVGAHVDAAIVAARLHSSTREELEQVRSLLDRAGIRAIGVVAGGARARGRYYRRGYSYAYEYR